MVEISRDGKRVCWTNSLYSTWGDQFHPGERGGAMVMARNEGGEVKLDPDFWVGFPQGYRAHQIRLEERGGGTAPPTASATPLSDPQTHP